jgi:hypothetical protein
MNKLSALSPALVLLASGMTAPAQEPETPRYLKNLSPAGFRSHLTDSAAVLGFALSNPTDAEMQARLLTFYHEAPNRQYGRDVRVPAKATLWSWSCIGSPPRPQKSTIALETLLYDRTGDRERLLRSPEGPPAHSELARFQPREPGTMLMLDADLGDGSQTALTPEAEAQAMEVRDLVRVFRHRLGLSVNVHALKQRFLPPVLEGLDGMDHFVLSSDRIADDVPGQKVLREWVQRGGSLWVLLDRVAPQTVATLLGNDQEFQVIDRVSLTNVHIRSGPANPHRPDSPARDLQEPVDFIRVVVPRSPVLYTVNGWPAAFRTEVGRGRVLFTTLGARGWMRPRTDSDPQPKVAEFPHLPVPVGPFEFLADELQPEPERPLLSTEDLRSYVTQQVRYSVVSRDTFLLVFGVFLLVLTVAGVALGRRGWLEHLGWLGPTLALAAGGVLVVLGESTRRAVPATVAVAQILDTEPGLEEVPAAGILAVYQPSSSSSPIGAEQGGAFDLDMTGLDGRVHRRVLADPDRWHWENLELPAGLRTASFRYTVRVQEPVEARVRFGPEGAEGQVAAGPFGQLEDPLLSMLGQHTVAVRLRADGTFLASSDDELSAGPALLGGLLSDRQRARQSLYQKLLAEPQPRYITGRQLLLAWAEPVDMHFTLGPQARTLGSALLTIPLRYERTPPGTRVTVPSSFVSCRRITSDGRSLRPAVESRSATQMQLRFEIPASVRPLVVESARLTVKFYAPAREVAIGDEAAPWRRLTNPLGVEHIEITDPRLLQLDEHGALSVPVRVGEARGGTALDLWRLESAGLEVRGRTEDEHVSR